MNEQEFNMKCAEYMGGSATQELNDWDMSQWNPYRDANDRNKVIEKMEIHTMFNNASVKWDCYTVITFIDVENVGTSESMEQAQIDCITQVLEAL